MQGNPNNLSSTRSTSGPLVPNAPVASGKPKAKSKPKEETVFRYGDLKPGQQFTLPKQEETYRYVRLRGITGAAIVEGPARLKGTIIGTFKGIQVVIPLEVK